MKNIVDRHIEPLLAETTLTDAHCAFLALCMGAQTPGHQVFVDERYKALFDYLSDPQNQAEAAEAQRQVAMHAAQYPVILQQKLTRFYEEDNHRAVHAVLNALSSIGQLTDTLVSGTIDQYIEKIFSIDLKTPTIEQEALRISDYFDLLPFYSHVFMNDYMVDDVSDILTCHYKLVNAITDEQQKKHVAYRVLGGFIQGVLHLIDSDEVHGLDLVEATTFLVTKWQSFLTQQECEYMLTLMFSTLQKDNPINKEADYIVTKVPFEKFKKIAVRLKVFPKLFDKHAQLIFLFLGNITKQKIQSAAIYAKSHPRSEAEDSQHITKYFNIFESFATAYADLFPYVVSQNNQDSRFYYECAFQMWLQILPSHYQMMRTYPLIQQSCKIFPETPRIFAFDQKSNTATEGQARLDASAGIVVTYFITRITDQSVWSNFYQPESDHLQATVAYCDSMRNLFFHFCIAAPVSTNVFGDVKKKQLFLRQAIFDLLTRYHTIYEGANLSAYERLLDSWMSLLDFARRLGIPYSGIAPSGTNAPHFFASQIQTHIQGHQYEVVWLKLVQIWVLIRDKQADANVPVVFQAPLLAGHFIEFATDAQFEAYLHCIKYVYADSSEAVATALQATIWQGFFDELQGAIATDALPYKMHKRLYQLLAQCASTARKGKIGNAEYALPEVVHNPLYFELATYPSVGITDPLLAAVVMKVLLQTTPSKKTQGYLQQIIDRVLRCEHDSALFALTGKGDSAPSVDADLFFSYTYIQAISQLIAIEHEVPAQQWRSVPGLLEVIPRLVSAIQVLLEVRQRRLRAYLLSEKRFQVATANSVVVEILQGSWLSYDLHEAVSLYYGLYDGFNTAPMLHYQHAFIRYVKNGGKYTFPTAWKLYISPIDHAWYICVRYAQEPWLRAPVSSIQQAGWVGFFPFSFVLLGKKQNRRLVLFRQSGISGKSAAHEFSLAHHEEDVPAPSLWHDAPVATYFATGLQSTAWGDILAGKIPLVADDVVYLEQRLSQPGHDAPYDSLSSLQEAVYSQIIEHKDALAATMLYLKTQALLSKALRQKIFAIWNRLGASSEEASAPRMLRALFVLQNSALALSVLRDCIRTEACFQLSEVKWLHEQMQHASMQPVQEIWYLFVKQCTTGKASSKYLPLKFTSVDRFFQWAAKDTQRLYQYYQGFLAFDQEPVSLDTCHYYLTMRALFDAFGVQDNVASHVSFMLLIMQRAAPNSLAYQEALTIMADYRVQRVEAKAIYLTDVERPIPFPKKWDESARHQLVTRLRDSVEKLSKEQAHKQRQAARCRQLGKELLENHNLAESDLRSLVSSAPQYIDCFLAERAAYTYPTLEEAFVQWRFFHQYRDVLASYASYDAADSALLQAACALLEPLNMAEWLDAHDTMPAMREAFLRQVTTLDLPSFFVSRCTIDDPTRFLYQLYLAWHFPSARPQLEEPIKSYLHAHHELGFCDIDYAQGMQLRSEYAVVIDIPAHYMDMRDCVPRAIAAYLVKSPLVSEMQPWIHATAANDIRLSLSDTFLKWHPRVRIEAPIKTDRMAVAQSALTYIQESFFKLPLLQLSAVVDPVYWELLPGLLPYLGSFSITGVFAWQAQQLAADKALTCGDITTVTIVSEGFFAKSPREQEPLLDYLGKMGFFPAAGAAQSVRYFKKWGRVALGLRIKAAPYPDEIIALTKRACTLSEEGITIPRGTPEALLSAHATRNVLLAQWPWSVVRVIKWINRSIPNGAQDAFNRFVSGNGLAPMLSDLLVPPVQNSLPAKSLELVQGAIDECNAQRQMYEGVVNRRAPSGAPKHATR